MAELRRQFDSEFARAPQTESVPFEDFLAIRVGVEPYALRLTEVAGLVADKAVTRLPGAPPGLLGISGFRGEIVSVFDLRVLLGSAGGEPPRWLVLTAADSTVGLAFDQFEGHVRVPQDAVVGTPGAELVRVGEAVRPIVRIPSVLHAIKQRTR
ncbi:MAG: chemotaxis protein CheW [Acidimicrobiia bacterium]